MKLPIFREDFVIKSEFISFWSRQYSYENEHLYDDNIGKELTEERVWALFLWKNGKPLSEKKRTSIRENFINDQTRIPVAPNSFFLSTYLNKAGGAIWRIFWLHCNHPEIYPMYDQHVHRAMARLNAWKKLEIPFQNKDKVEMYINHYLLFWKEFSEFSYKKVDEALWAYGKFIKLGYHFS